MQKSKEREVMAMNCINCHQEIPEGSRFCPHCGVRQPETGNSREYEDNTYQQSANEYQNTNSYENQYQYAQYSREEPVNWVPYLILSIISTVCCCIPLGIVAIFYTVKINNAVSTGDAESARHAANMAKIWIIVAVVVGIVIDIIAYVLTGVISELGYYYYY